MLRARDTLHSARVSVLPVRHSRVGHNKRESKKSRTPRRRTTSYPGKRNCEVRVILLPAWRGYLGARVSGFSVTTIFGRSKRNSRAARNKEGPRQVAEARSREEGCCLVSGTQSKLFVVVFLSSSRRGMAARRRRHDPRCCLAAGRPPPNVERQRWQDVLQVEDASSLWYDASEPIAAAPVAQRTSQERSRRAENDPLSSHSSQYTSEIGSFLVKIP